MMVCSPIRSCVKKVVSISGCRQRQMLNQICCRMPQSPSGACCFSLSRHVNSKFIVANSGLSIVGPDAAKQRSSWPNVSVASAVNSRHPQKSCLQILLGSQGMKVRFLAPKQGTWFKGYSSGGLVFGLLVCYSTSEPVHAEAALPKENKEDDSTASFSHGKQVYTDYSVIGIPGDGRCLFRAVAHGACLCSGKPAPSERTQRELADELRARVADEFLKRRKETEWFIEGDFDTYVSQLRKSHVWGGEPELLMASHVLKMPITVYMNDRDSGGLITIAEYGQEYGKGDPIKVLYHGFGHYDALRIPGKKDARSRL